MSIKVRTRGSYDSDETTINGEDYMSTITQVQALAYEGNTGLVKGLWRNLGCARNGNL
jgi:hypothetical protein